MFVLPTLLVAIMLSLGHWALWGSVIVADVTVYKAAMIAVLAAAGVGIYWKRLGLEYAAVWALIGLRTVAGWELWNWPEEVFWLSFLNFVFGCGIMFLAQTREGLIVAALFMGNFFLGIGEMYGLLPTRGEGFSGLYYPDLLAVSNYLALFFLAKEDTDAGGFIKRVFRRYAGLGRLGTFGYSSNAVSVQKASEDLS